MFSFLRVCTERVDYSLFFQVNEAERFRKKEESRDVRKCPTVKTKEVKNENIKNLL